MSIGESLIFLFEIPDILIPSVSSGAWIWLLWGCFLANLGLPQFVRYQAVGTEARVKAIAQEPSYHDLLLMAATQSGSLQRLSCGSLAEDVVQHCRKSLLMVHGRKA